MGILLLFLFAAAIITAIGTLALIHYMRHPSRKTFANALARNQPTDPADLELTAKEHTFRFDDGTQSPGWIVQGNKPHGPTVIVTHGWSNSRFGSLNRLSALVDFASRIVIYDMRAHGDSTAKEATLAIKEPDDLLAIMDQVNTGSPVVLLGSSMGAGVTIVAAAKYFEQNLKQVEAGQCDESQSVDLVGVIAEAPYRFPTQALKGYLWRKKLPPYPVVWFTGWHFAFWEGIRKATYDRAVHAKKIKCPLLVLHGDRDCVCPVQAGQEIAEEAPDGSFINFPDQDHVNLCKADEALYRASLSDFFAKI